MRHVRSFSVAAENSNESYWGGVAGLGGVFLGGGYCLGLLFNNTSKKGEVCEKNESIDYAGYEST